MPGPDPPGLSLSTSLTKAKRKREPTEATEHLENDNLHDWNLGGTERSSQTIVAQDILSRKSARVSNLIASARRFAGTLGSLTGSLPTPDLREHRVGITNTGSEQRPLQLLDTSPTPGPFKDAASLVLEKESGLTTTVLKLIRSDNLELKASTEMQLRHEIDLELDLGAARLQRQKETISKLYKRADELEAMVLHTTE